ncbi:MAG TPA: 3-hydroxyacyl-CoA dehydrogenase family protein, partial [Anaerolineae bacterium]
MTFRNNKVAVLGAGTMGGGIAAHLANIGIDVVLLDMVPPNLSEAEKNDPKARNRIVNAGYERMAKARPANLARDDRAKFITLGNFEDNLDKIADCDWIVEAIVEQLEPKQQLMARVEEMRKPNSIVSSNTSGIPIHEIAEGRSADFKAHFLGTHFFNPPRYLELLEVIPTEDTKPEVVDFMVKFGRDVLGKGVVVTKDTPNFIANRFIAIAGSYAVEYALEHGYSIEEIDAITGELLGRPKTATFRLTDLVGLDVMVHVNRNLYPAIPDDDYRGSLVGDRSTELYDRMLENQWLGNKTGQGFYKRVDVDGERQFWVLNPETMEYEPPTKVRFESVGAVRKIEDLGQRLRALLQHDDRAAQYVRDTLYYTLAYAAYITPEIAYSIVDVDHANRWGFAHQAGPFEIWDMLDVRATAEEMEAAGLEVAEWVKEMLDSGHEGFYQNGRYYDFESKSYKPIDKDNKVVVIDDLRAAGKE